jgi:hypothetical protein
MDIVLSTVVVIGAVALASYVWKTNKVRDSVKLEELADTRLVDEFVQSSEILARFYNRSTPPQEQQAAMAAYKRILAINGELQRRKASLKLLEPFLHDDRDAVRVVTAMALARPGDERCIKILKDVAERPEMSPSNVVMLAQFFLENIYKQKEHAGKH